MMDVAVCSVARLGLTIWDPMQYSPASFSVYGILQARIMKWVAISHSKFMDNKIQQNQKNPTATSEESEQGTVHAPCTQHHLFSSVTPLCLILCDPMDYSTSGFPVLHCLPEFAQTHVHWVNDASNHLILCHPLLLLPSVFPRIKGFSYESSLGIKRPKYWSFSFSLSPSSEYSGLIPSKPSLWPDSWTCPSPHPT